jgi:hypothetical protein
MRLAPGLKALIFAENVIYICHAMNNSPRPLPEPGAYFFGGVSEEPSKEA